MHAVEKGVSRPEANLLTGLTLATIAVSVVAHGVSVTPLMKIYNRWASRAG
jgi:NhaP-type Na+/H+ or K+/H+ antiporter